MCPNYFPEAPYNRSCDTDADCAPDYVCLPRPGDIPTLFCSQTCNTLDECPQVYACPPCENTTLCTAGICFWYGCD